MPAMQYSFTLPADYDMARIRRRVDQKGRALDHHTPLAFKTYLMTRKDDSHIPDPANRYACFYLWRDATGMRDFLCDTGFTGLTASFGRPRVLSWPLLLDRYGTNRIAHARFATRQLIHLPETRPLQTLRDDARAYAERLHQDGAAPFHTLTAFEPTGWTLVRFSLWRAFPTRFDPETTRVYDVLHVSEPTPPTPQRNAPCPSSTS